MEELTELEVDLDRTTERLARAARREGLLDVAVATHDSPVGPLLVAVTPRGLVRLAFAEEPVDEVLQELSDRVSPRVLEAREAAEPVARQLDEYFSGRRRDFDLPLDWSLSAGFRRRVLEATAALPFGTVSSYGELARRTGSPRAARAVGSALGSNPIPVVVPCHRVLRTGGALGGYGGGLDKKRYLLELEGVL